MGSLMGSKPKSQGPTKEQLAAQAEADKRSKEREESANRQMSSASRFAKNRRTGRRLLLAPGRENEIAQLGDGQGSTGANY